MEQLIIDPSKYNFSSKEFKCNSGFDGTIYSHRFPVLKYKNRTTTLECELSIDADSGKVFINVFDMGRVPYSPFYHTYCGNYSPLLERIYNAIEVELIRLGMKK